MSGRILIADDAGFMREMLGEILGEAGYTIVAEATDGAEAVELFKEHSPDLVTLDIVMPRKSGLEALSEIRELDPGARIVMCSALGQEQLVEDAKEAGASDYVIKPFKPAQVLDVIERVIAKGPEPA